MDSRSIIPQNFRRFGNVKFVRGRSHRKIWKSSKVDCKNAFYVNMLDGRVWPLVSVSQWVVAAWLSVAPFCFVCTPRTCATSDNSTKRSFQNLHHIPCTCLISIFFKSPGLKSSIQCGVCFRLLWDTRLYWNYNYETRTQPFRVFSDMFQYEKNILFQLKNCWSYKVNI